jgi:tight adherence protein C
MDATTGAAVGISAIAMLGFGIGAWQFLSPERSAADRLAEFTGGGSEGQSTRLSALTRSAARLSRGDESEIAVTRRWLSQAGLRGRNAAEIYSASRTLGLVFGSLIGFLLVLFLHRGEERPPDAIVTATQRLRGLSWYLGGTLVGASIGYYGPYVYVANSIAKRKERLILALPDALDLLVTAVEAGLALDAGFRRVADEMEIASPELAGELQLVNHEVMAGVPRVDALRRLEERVGLEDVTSLVNVLIQAERFGSSVSRALRVHSGHIRVKRMQRAETKAAQVSPKLTVVMIIFILPTLLIVLLGPAAIRMKNILIPAAQDQGVAP